MGIEHFEVADERPKRDQIDHHERKIDQSTHLEDLDAKAGASGSIGILQKANGKSVKEVIGMCTFSQKLMASL
ncbi:hypothetical protein [Duganella sp. 1224]|uniref:hypothetical protein n=1 Tax=Duganella sp. 1224 TaxID=2587052 RepID=UPI0015CA170A|nr:hypothetical protein [Duganella sp. 1224]